MANIKLEDFKGFKIEMNFDEIAEKHAKALAEQINSNASKHGWGDYAKSWTVTKKRIKGEDAFIVHSTIYQLAHLLEKGHLIVNKKGGVGWSAPREHIKPASDYEVKAFYDDVKNMKIKSENKGG